MLSRVADSLYWMSRYLERAEHIARLVDVHYNLILESDTGSTQQKRLSHLLESLNLPSDNLDDAEAVMRRLTFDGNASVSILANLTSARGNARQVREWVSSEMWTQINKLYLFVKNADADTVWSDSPHDYYVNVRQGSHLFQGITDATMNHNQGWHFIQIGRYIERILSLVKLLDVHFHDINLSQRDELTPHRYFELVTILKSNSAFEAYCKVYNPNLQSAWITEFLLFSEAFPRSVRFCVEQILDSLNELADTTMRNKNIRLHRIAGRLQSSLNYDDMADVRTSHLHEYLENIKHQTLRIHDTLYDTYITYSIEPSLR